MDKIIFLDIDGVLNTSQSRDWSMKQFVPSLVRNLVKIIDQTGAKIVISSDWRFGGIGDRSMIHSSMKNVCDAGDIDFNKLFGSIIGKTLDLPGSRQDQILDWVDANDVKNWIAIDDADWHFPDNPDWLILTNDQDGLTDDVANKAIAKLNSK